MKTINGSDEIDDAMGFWDMVLAAIIMHTHQAEGANLYSDGWYRKLLGFTVRAMPAEITAWQAEARTILCIGQEAPQSADGLTLLTVYNSLWHRGALSPADRTRLRGEIVKLGIEAAA